MLWGTRWPQRRAMWRRRPWQRQTASSANWDPPAWWRCRSGSGKSPACYRAARYSGHSSPRSAVSYGVPGLAGERVIEARSNKGGGKWTVWLYTCWKAVWQFWQGFSALLRLKWEEPSLMSSFHNSWIQHTRPKALENLKDMPEPDFF